MIFLSSFIYNYSHLEKTQMSLKWGMGKYSELNPSNGILPNDKNNELLIDSRARLYTARAEQAFEYFNNLIWKLYEP